MGLPRAMPIPRYVCDGNPTVGIWIQASNCVDKVGLVVLVHCDFPFDSIEVQPIPLMLA